MRLLKGLHILGNPDYGLFQSPLPTCNLGIRHRGHHIPALRNSTQPDRLLHSLYPSLQRGQMLKIKYPVFPDIVTNTLIKVPLMDVMPAKDKIREWGQVKPG